MSYVDGFQCEDLAEALLRDEGDYEIEKAAPRRRRHVRGQVVEDEPAYDLLGRFDLLAFTPNVLRRIQVTRHEQAVSEKMVQISEHGPSPGYCRDEVWVWKGDGFTVHHCHWTDDEPRWEAVEHVVVDSPGAVLARADVSLG